MLRKSLEIHFHVKLNMEISMLIVNVESSMLSVNMELHVKS